MQPHDLNFDDKLPPLTDDCNHVADKTTHSETPSAGTGFEIWKSKTAAVKMNTRANTPVAEGGDTIKKAEPLLYLGKVTGKIWQHLQRCNSQDWQGMSSICDAEDDLGLLKNQHRLQNVHVQRSCAVSPALQAVWQKLKKLGISWRQAETTAKRERHCGTAEETGNHLKTGRNNSSERERHCGSTEETGNQLNTAETTAQRERDTVAQLKKRACILRWTQLSKDVDGCVSDPLPSIHRIHQLSCTAVLSAILAATLCGPKCWSVDRWLLNAWYTFEVFSYDYWMYHTNCTQLVVLM